MRIPNPDPGELWTDINMQLFGNSAPAPGQRPTMVGFVQNYLAQQQLNPQRTYDPKSVMHYFASAQLPVLSQLAQKFAVCDHWFASAPCQTWPNRWFVHAATADGHENNDPPHFPNVPTIFNRLEQAGIDSWKIFDNMFSVYATQGVESKKTGEFTRKELAPIAEFNVTSLKEYDYFTYANANGRQLEFNDPPADYYLEFDPKDTVLTLHFTLPLKKPVKANQLTVEVYDREFFIGFSFAEKNPVKLVGAPAPCKLSVLNPDQMDASLAQQLAQLGADQRNPNLTIGSEYANRIVVKCP